MLLPSFALAVTPDLSGYQGEDGAITVSYQGNSIDPYFATKALLLAADGGFDITIAGRKWVDWLMAQQREDGLFERYRRNTDTGRWESYARTDADDAMLALWMELLTRLSPHGGKKWQDSFDRAAAQLEALYQPEGIYHISTELHVGLVMDNIEIYAAFRRMSRDYKHMGSNKNAKLYAHKADALKDNIIKVFLKPETSSFAVSTQTRTDPEAFYPDKVAQLFPLFYFPYVNENTVAYKKWIGENREAWHAMREKDYPWGIVAIAALRLGDSDTAFCWKTKAEPMRYGKQWNILEEMSLQYVVRQLFLHPPHAKVACVTEES
jgi:hypothetical protein